MATMRRQNGEMGFTLVELIVVVLVIGILVAIAIPVYNSSRTRSQQRTCFANQRTVEGSVQMWHAADETRSVADLAGVVSGGHALIGAHIFNLPPRCPSAPEPADPMAVDVATGAYELDAAGHIQPCGHGNPVHGLYR